MMCFIWWYTWWWWCCWWLFTASEFRYIILRLRAFFKVQISSCALITLLKPGKVHSGSSS